MSHRRVHAPRNHKQQRVGPEGEHVRVEGDACGEKNRWWAAAADAGTGEISCCEWAYGEREREALCVFMDIGEKGDHVVEQDSRKNRLSMPLLEQKTFAAL